MNLEQFNREFSKEETKTFFNSNLKRYLVTNELNLSTNDIDHILDYLDSPGAPKRFLKMSIKDSHRLANQWTQRMIKKSDGIKELENDIDILFDFEDGMKLVRLTGENAFKREGNLMSHCVGSYFNKENIEIISLRDKNNNPHCTIELQTDEDHITQIKGKGNGSIHPKYIDYIVFALELFGQNVRESELENLGYVNLDSISPDFTRFIKDKCKTAKFKVLNEKELLYKYSI